MFHLIVDHFGGMNSEKEIAIKTDKKSCRQCGVKTRGTCIWLKEEGSRVYKSEEIGYVVVDKDFRTPVRAPIEGRIKKLVIHVGLLCIE